MILSESNDHFQAVDTKYSIHIKGVSIVAVGYLM